MIRNEIYINKAGLRSFIITSNMPNSIALAEQYNLNIERKYLRKEIELVTFV